MAQPRCLPCPLHPQGPFWLPAMSTIESGPPLADLNIDYTAKRAGLGYPANSSTTNTPQQGSGFTPWDRSDLRAIAPRLSSKLSFLILPPTPV